MKAHWEAFETEIEGTPAWILYNATAAGELPGLDLPNLLRVQVDCESDENGLPAPAEEDRLQELELELEEWIAALGGRFVGHVTAAGMRTLFFYVACGHEEAENLVRRIAIRRDIELGMRMEADPQNRVYFELLLPTADERRNMRNMTLISELVAGGDTLEEVRPIEHTAAFGNRHQAIAFANWARKNGFVVDGILSPAPGREHFILQFHKQAAPQPQIMDEDTAMISHMAGQLGGRYEGWQAELRVAEAV